MKSNKIVKSENMPSAVLDIYEDGSGRVTFFNDENHWHGEIFLTKEQIEFYYREYSYGSYDRRFQRVYW